jgi:hypothetical protein
MTKVYINRTVTRAQMRKREKSIADTYKWLQSFVDSWKPGTEATWYCTRRDQPQLYVNPRAINKREWAVHVLVLETNETDVHIRVPHQDGSTSEKWVKPTKLKDGWFSFDDLFPLRQQLRKEVR